MGLYSIKGCNCPTDDLGSSMSISMSTSSSRVETGEPSLRTIFSLVLLGAFVGAAVTFRFIASDNSSVVSKYTNLASSYDDETDSYTDTDS